MEIFDKDYPYKLKLLGYSLQQKENEYIKANMYIKTHETIHTISYVHTVTDKHYLIDTKGYDDVEIFQAQFFGVCNENLNLVRVNVTPDDLLRKNIPNAHVIIKLLDEDAEIIATDYFSMDINAEKLVLYPEKFEQVPSTILLRKLTRA